MSVSKAVKRFVGVNPIEAKTNVEREREAKPCDDDDVISMYDR